MDKSLRLKINFVSSRYHNWLPRYNIKKIALSAHENSEWRLPFLKTSRPTFFPGNAYVASSRSKKLLTRRSSLTTAHVSSLRQSWRGASERSECASQKIDATARVKGPTVREWNNNSTVLEILFTSDTFVTECCISMKKKHTFKKEIFKNKLVIKYYIT